MKIKLYAMLAGAMLAGAIPAGAEVLPPAEDGATYLYISRAMTRSTSRCDTR